MLEFQNVSYQYPSEDFDIIDHLSFAVEPGSFHCIIGISGCGKSTIFRMTNGLLKPKAGTILVEGKPIAGRKRYCGYMPQKDLLFPWRTVGENVALPLEIQGELTRAERRDRAEAALADVGLAGCGSKMPDELSGGMRQRAAFARTMLTGCDLLLLDEPFSALDFLTRISMQEWLLDQWQRHQKDHPLHHPRCGGGPVPLLERAGGGAHPHPGAGGDSGARVLPAGPVLPETAGDGGAEGASHRPSAKAGDGMKKSLQGQSAGPDLSLCPADALAGGGHGIRRGLYPAVSHPDPGEAVGAAGCPLHRSSARHHAGDRHRPGDLSGAGPGPGGGDGRERPGAPDDLSHRGGVPDHPHHRHCARSSCCGSATASGARCW